MSKSVRKKLIIGSVILLFYLALLFLMAHIFCHMKESGKPFLFALEGGIEHIHKGFFNIFPIPGKAFFASAFILFLVLFAYYGIYLTQKQKAHYKKDEALGSARWLQGKEYEDYVRNKTEPFGKNRDDGFGNIILAQGFNLSMNNRVTNRNCNTVVVAGSGRGKSFRFVGPNLLQCNASYVVTDPSGTLYRQYGNFLERKGYRVKCLNIQKMNRSCHYNPFAYIHSDKDIMVLVDVLIKNTTPKGARASDDFWEKAESNLLCAVIALQYHYMDDRFKNFSTTLDLIRMGNIAEEGGDPTKNKLAAYFKKYEKDDPTGFAFSQYGNFALGAEKTIKSILVSCAFRIKAFDLKQVRTLTSRDDLELDTLGDQKTALFIITPTESTFNYIAALMYSQLFIRLYDYSESTAIFTQVVRDEKGDVIRTFRAEDRKHAKKAKKIAEKYVEDIKSAVVVRDNFHKWYEIRTASTEDGKGNELITIRKTEKEARAALENLQSAHLEENGEMLPIHVRFILDEYANIGGAIPDFDQRISTARKYNMSISIILQSLAQIMKTNKEEWSTILGNADNLLYMGGGVDKESTELIASQIGRQTRQVAGLSFGRNGSMSISSHAVDLQAVSDLRMLKDKEVVILPVGLPPFKGMLYETTKHPNWKYVETAKPYRHRQERINYFLSESIRTNYRTEAENPDRRHGGVGGQDKPRTAEKKNEALNKARAKNADQFKKRVDPDGNPIVNHPVGLDRSGNSVAPALGITSPKELKKTTESLFAMNKDMGRLYTVYERAPVDKLKSAS